MTSGGGSGGYGDFVPPHEEEISTETLAADRNALGATAAANPAVEYYVRYRHAETESYGILEGGLIHQLNDHYFASPRRTGATVPLRAVRLLSPLDPNRVSKVIGVALNTVSAALPSVARDTHPRWFAKFPTSLTGPGGGIEVPEEATQLIHEAELVLVIGRSTRNVSVAEAPAAIWGVTGGNDLTERGWIREEQGRDAPPKVMGKGCDTFAALGPAIAVGLDYGDLHIEHRVDGRVTQSGGTAGRLHSPAELVAYASRFMTLLPGDLVYTGATPFVEGAQRFVAPGQELEVEVEGIGILRNRTIRMPGSPWTA